MQADEATSIDHYLAASTSARLKPVRRGHGSSSPTPWPHSLAIAGATACGDRGLAARLLRQRRCSPRLGTERPAPDVGSEGAGVAADSHPRQTCPGRFRRYGRCSRGLSAIAGRPGRVGSGGRCGRGEPLLLGGDGGVFGADQVGEGVEWGVFSGS